MKYPDRENRLELHYAALNNDVGQVRARLAAGDEVNAADKAGFTPLHMACQQWACDTAVLLLDSGANPNAENKFGNTPLWTAVLNSQGRGELIQALRRHGADPFHKNKFGHSAISAAREIANFPVAQWFADLPA